MLTETQILQNREKFITELKSIPRQGMDNLIAWLDKTDFFTAPATSKYHGNYRGGLCEHTLDTLKCSMMLYETYMRTDLGENVPKNVAVNELKLACLLHDVRKVLMYYPQNKRKIDDNGVWHTVAGWMVKDLFPFGGSEKSVFYVGKFIELTGPEALAIRWCRGEGELATHLDVDYSASLRQSMKLYPIVSIINEGKKMAMNLLGKHDEDVFLD